MTQSRTLAVALATIGAAMAVPAYAEADISGPMRPAQSLTLEQVRQAEQVQKERGDFSLNKYTTTYISAIDFVNYSDGTAPVYSGSAEYRYRPASALHASYDAHVSLPQGAKVCYIGLYYKDTDTGLGNDVSAWLRTSAGFDQTHTLSTADLDVVTSVDGAYAYDYRSAMQNPFTIGTPPFQITLPGCYTINNDITNHGGGGYGALYTVRVALPVTGNTMGFRAVDLRWYRQIATAPTTATFDDVPTSHWAFQQVEALKASGITSGTSATTFAPDDTVTRAQMAVFLARALGLYWPD